MDSTCLSIYVDRGGASPICGRRLLHRPRCATPWILVAQLIPIVDRLNAEYRPKKGLEKHTNVQLVRLYRQR